MKHFKIIGEETTREFDIEDDEMLKWTILKIRDYENELKEKNTITYATHIPSLGSHPPHLRNLEN